MTEQPLGIGILGAAGIAERAIVEPARELDGVSVVAITHYVGDWIHSALG